MLRIYKIFTKDRFCYTEKIMTNAFIDAYKNRDNDKKNIDWFKEHYFFISSLVFSLTKQITQEWIDLYLNVMFHNKLK